MAKISTKNQITLPVDALRRIGWKPGDEVVVEPEDTDRLTIRRIEKDPSAGLGVFEGLYEPGYLDELRAKERA